MMVLSGAVSAALMPSETKALKLLLPSQPTVHRDLHIRQQWFRIQPGQVLDVHNPEGDFRIWVFKALPLELDAQNDPTDQISQDIAEIPLFLQAYQFTHQQWQPAGSLRATSGSGLSSASGPMSIALNNRNALILSSTDGATGQGVDLQVMDFWRLDLRTRRYTPLPSIAIASDNAGSEHPAYDLHAEAVRLTIDDAGHIFAHMRWQGQWPKSLRNGPVGQDCTYQLSTNAWKSQQVRCNAIQQFIRP